MVSSTVSSTSLVRQFRTNTLFTYLLVQVSTHLLSPYQWKEQSLWCGDNYVWLDRKSRTNQQHCADRDGGQNSEREERIHIYFHIITLKVKSGTTLLFSGLYKRVVFVVLLTHFYCIVHKSLQPVVYHVMKLRILCPLFTPFGNRKTDPRVRHGVPSNSLGVVSSRQSDSTPVSKSSPSDSTEF